MNVIGISMMKDEADVVETTVKHMLCEVDAVIVADNQSHDGTREILDALADQHANLFVVADDEPGYYQAAKMSALAARAAVMGAQWVVPFDADEIWMSEFKANKPDRPTVAKVLMNLPAEHSIAGAVLYDHIASPDDGGGFDMPYRRRDPAVLPKVAARASSPVRIAMGNHGADFGTMTPNPVLHVRHFPIRSAEQMIRKARNGSRAYALTNLDESFGKHWRDWGKLSDDQIRDAFHRYYFVEFPRRSASVRRDPLCFLW